MKSRLNQSDRDQFQGHADRHWQPWLDNNAVQVLSLDDSQKLEQLLQSRGDEELILQSRWILTDKKDGTRTLAMPLPLLAN